MIEESDQGRNDDHQHHDAKQPCKNNHFNPSSVKNQLLEIILG
jgi:hypothetical protein